MVKKLFESLFISLLFVITYYAVIYLGGFSSDLTYDIESRCGRQMVHKVHKKKTGFWKKFTFWHFRKKVNKWRYALFWLNFVASLAMLFFINAYIWWEAALWTRQGCKITAAILLLTSLLGTNYLHYFRNCWYKVRPRLPKRKKRDK